MVAPGEGCPVHSISPYLSQNTTKLVAALHSIRAIIAFLGQVPRDLTLIGNTKRKLKRVASNRIRDFHFV
jgi:hypothetical protein